jgi:hypothetical protein
MKIIFAFLVVLIVGVLVFDLSLIGETSNVVQKKVSPGGSGGPILHPYVGVVTSKNPHGKSFSYKEYKAILKGGIASVLRHQLIWMSQNGGKYVIYYPLRVGNGVAMYHVIDSHKSDSTLFSAMKTMSKNGRIEFGACPTAIPVGGIADDRMSAFFEKGPPEFFYTKDLR